MPLPAIRLPISNRLTGGTYTGVLHLGSNAVPANLVLDSGSSMLAIGGDLYDPVKDAAANTSNILQVAHYLSGGFVGGVVQTQIAIPNQGQPALVCSAVNLAVTYEHQNDAFGKADGILGLAYKGLDDAYEMPANTWQNRYDANQITLGKPYDIDPYFDRLSASGLVGKKFAFCVRRALASLRLDANGTDPLNDGIFVLGGGEECTDLYAGGFSSVAIMDENHYNTNLLSIQVGGQPPITVGPLSGTPPFNSIIDSGTPSLILDQDVYDRLMASFAAVNPSFATLLRQFGFGAGSGYDQSQLNLAAWPPLKLCLQSPSDTSEILTILPADYWQFDALGKGMAVAVIVGDNGMLGGQSVLGLPLFCGYFVVFDRAQNIIRFAPQVLPAG